MTAVCATLRRFNALDKTLVAIRCECKAQGLDDDTRRDLIEHFAGPGKRSGRDMMPEQANALNHLRQKAFKPGAEWRFVFNLTPDKMALGKKIYRCAEKLGALQQPPIPVMSKAYVEGAAKQALGLNHPDFAGVTVKKLEHCTVAQLHLVVQILESWAKTRVKKQGA